VGDAIGITRRDSLWITFWPFCTAACLSASGGEQPLSGTTHHSHQENQHDTYSRGSSHSTATAEHSPPHRRPNGLCFTPGGNALAQLARANTILGEDAAEIASQLLAALEEMRSVVDNPLLVRVTGVA
jgi:hypothetical protein